MLNIDSSRNKNSLLPSYYLDKIVLEQNLGFIKGFDDPHISSDQETDNEQAESVSLSLTIESSYSIKKTGGRLKSPALKHLLGESLKTAIVFWEPNDEEMVGIDSGVYGISYYEKHFKDKLSGSNTTVFEQADAIKEKQKIGFSTDEYEVFNFKNTKSYQSKPTNLVLLYASYIEMPEGYVPTGTSKTIFSDINIEIVLKNGKALTQSRVYRLSDTKEIWTGAIQTVGSDQELRTVEANPRPVEVSFVKNYKIQDNRIQKTIEKEILKFTDLNNQIADAQMAKLETERTPTRISNLFLSNSIDGKVTAFFSFDQLGLLAHNALLFTRLDFESSDSPYALS